jgi:hypothetical protein
MSAVITANARLARDNVAPPPSVKEDGSGYTWRMFFDQNRRIADADELSDLLEVLMPGYSALETEDERYGERFHLAKAIQIQGRGVILSRLDDEFLEGLEQWERDLLMWDEITDPSGWGKVTVDDSGEEIIAPDVWSQDHPLILIDTFYAPFSTITRPISSDGDFVNTPRKNIIWLCPSSELDFLKSLSRINYIAFGRPRASERDDPKAL